MEAGAPAPLPGVYPVQATVARQESYSRLLIFVKWLFVLPNMIVLAFVQIAALFAIIASFFAVLFTGRYPRGLFGFVEGYLRWQWRVYAYFYLFTDRYPPFAMREIEDHPAKFDVAYPEGGIARWRALVQWLMIIPYAIVSYLIAIVGFFVVILAWFAILFTGKFPEGMFKLALEGQRWFARASAYALFTTDQYPPFDFGE